jgi:membrane protein
VVSWIVASVGFSFYLANFADYGATYGSMGAAIGLLLYLYITAFVVLLAGEINATVSRSQEEQDLGIEDRV